MLDRAGLLDRLERDPASLEARFHPIADLKRGTVAGYEAALAIGDSEPLPPCRWSREIHMRQAGALEARLVSSVLPAREALPDGAFLAVNVSSHAMLSRELQGALAAAGRLENVVLIVTDDAQNTDEHEVRKALEAVRDAGGCVAVDETGSGYASLRHVLALRPDYVRIGAEFVSDVDRDQAKAAVIEALTSLASRIDAWMITSGIPGRAELAALRRMGVPLGQGPLFGAPTAQPLPLPQLVVDAIRAVEPPPDAQTTVAPLVEGRPALPWGASLEEIADMFLDDPRHDVVVLVDERSRPLALAERAALLRGEPYERPVMRITSSSPLKAVARRAAARPLLERFHPLVVCDRRGVYLGVVRVEQLLDALAQDDD